jgi:hypothetical protein
MSPDTSLSPLEERGASWRFHGALIALYMPIRGYFHMRGETEERWRQLCEQAVHEKDPKKLIELMQEINRLLEAKEQRLLDNNEFAKQRGVA